MICIEKAIANRTKQNDKQTKLNRYLFYFLFHQILNNFYLKFLYFQEINYLALIISLSYYSIMLFFILINRENN